MTGPLMGDCSGSISSYYIRQFDKPLYTRYPVRWRACSWRG